MAEMEEPQFEVVDETARPRLRQENPKSRVIVLSGWRAKLLAPLVIAAVLALLLALGAALAAAALVATGAGVLLGAGFLAKKILFPSRPAKYLGQNENRLERKK